MYDIITIGSATQDIFMKSKHFEVVKSDDSEKQRLCFDYGTKINIEDVHFTLGGGGCNTAVSFAMLGLNTAFCGVVGKDQEGRRILKRLEIRGISTDFVVVSEKYKTALSVALHSPKGDRTILLFRGASDHLNKDLIDWKKLRKTKWLYISHLSGESDRLLDELVIFKKKNKKIKIAWNPGLTQLNKGIKKLSPMLGLTDILFLNKKEAQDFTEIDIPEYKDDVIRKDEFSQLFEKFLEYKIKVIAITDGARGAQVYSDSRIYTSRSFKEDLVDSTGAGDAFASGFTAGYIYTGDAGQALKWGIAQSGSVITEYGAQNGLLDRNGIESKIKLLK